MKKTILSIAVLSFMLSCSSQEQTNSTEDVVTDEVITEEETTSTETTSPSDTTTVSEEVNELENEVNDILSDI